VHSLNLIKDGFKNLALIALDFNSNSNNTANCYLSVALERKAGCPFSPPLIFISILLTQDIF
jgi:hypothetical protein